MFFTLQSNDNKPLITPKLDEADALAKQQEDTLIARYAVFWGLPNSAGLFDSMRD